MSIALAEKMSRSVAERQARVEELDSIIATAQFDEEEELRSTFRVAPSQRHDATSNLAKIRRKKTKAEEERSSLLRELEVLQDEARSASQAAAREQAEKVIADYREFPAAEQAYDREMKSALIELLDRFAETLPALWAEMRQHEQTALRLCSQANMVQDWEHARDQVYNRRTADNFLAHVEASIRSIKVDDLSGATRKAIEGNPSLLLSFKTAEESPTFHEATAPAYVWIDMSSAPLIEVGGPGGKQLQREWQGPDGLIHPAVNVRRSEPSEAERSVLDARTGLEAWRRVDAALLRRAS